MTGEPWAKLYETAVNDSQTLLSHGVAVADPVLAEIDKRGYVPEGVCGEQREDYADLANHWARDKKMLRWAHVLIDLSPEQKSEGVAHEIGYARYYLWKPIVRVYRNGRRPSASIAYFENDVIATSLEEAAQIIRERWGTRWKRFLWRLNMYRRCRLRALWHELGGWR